ncbi:MAG: carbohydrate-binding domain-containing protein [Lachnospiraceae bacterium]|nr:carbohydrate-binding domain-containing protein [Lachnospiraceae bacterium]
MKRITNLFLLLIMTAVFSGCSGKETGETVTYLTLSDQEILVDGKSISQNKRDAVYAGNEIIYYREGQGETYGNGGEEDAHSPEEAAQHTVITITKPGTYEVTGRISRGQIFVDLGEDAEDNPSAKVNLILNNAEITCTVAPSIIVYNAYECGSSKKKEAKPDVDTSNAGFNLILAKDSKNIINGSYVARIYEDGTTKKDIKNGGAKKKYKFDGTVESFVSFNIRSDENGKLIINAQKEGISSHLHLTIESGEIEINASNDSINTNEDQVSVLTINGGTVICNSGFGEEGDGLDSNGYLVVNGGYVFSCANSDSMDSGLDSDEGIYINGGIVFGSGNMYDEVKDESKQEFLVLMFDEKIHGEELIMITDEENQPITVFSSPNDFKIAVFSSPDLEEKDYRVYKVSSVTGNKMGNLYFDITDFKDAVLINL